MATGVGVGSGVGVGVGAANTSFVTPNSAPRSSVELTGMLPVITAPAAMSSTKKVLLPTIFPERSIMRTEMLPENNVSASVVLEIVTSTQDEDSLTVVSTEIPATGSPLRGKVCVAAVGLGDGVAEVSLPPQATRGISIRKHNRVEHSRFISGTSVYKTCWPEGILHGFINYFGSIESMAIPSVIVYVYSAMVPVEK